MSMRIGIVIVNYNRGRLVCEIVSVFAKYNAIDYLVVVDNCSTDDSRHLLKNIEGGKVKCLFPEDNGGYARGNNIGLNYLRKEQKCEICFVVNPDVFFEEYVITTVVSYMEKNPDYAIMTCAQKDPLSKRPSCQYGKRLFDTFGLHLMNYFNILRHFYILKKYYAYSYDGNNGIQMKCFENDEILDSGTFLYWEEQLLGFKVSRMGYKIGFIPSCLYEHRHIQFSSTANSKSLRLFKYNLDSQRYLQQKYLHFNFLQRKIIFLAEIISLIERWLINYMKGILKNR